FSPKQRRVPPKCGEVAAGPVEAPDDAELDGIAADREHDGYRCRRRLGCQYRRITALRHNERHMAAHEFCRQRGKPIVVTLRPAVFDRDVLAFDVAGFLQTLAECGNEVRIRSRRSAVEITDHWNNRLLRVRRERPRSHRAAERGYQFPPSDSDRHVALPCEGWLVKATISRRKRAVLRSGTTGCDRAPRPTLRLRHFARIDGSLAILYPG